VATYDRTLRITVQKYNHTTEEYEDTDISGGTVTLHVFESYDEENGFTNEVTKWQKNATITDAANGLCTITFEDTDTTIADIGIYYYYIDFTDGIGNKYQVVMGKIKVV